MRRKNLTMKINPLIIVVMVLSFFAIIFKIVYLDVRSNIDGINLTEFTNNRNTSKRIIKANRGSIYTVDGETLARTVNSYTVIAYLSSSRTKDNDNPQHVVDVQMTVDKLAPILGFDPAYLTLLLTQDKYQVELGPNGRGISELLKKQIEALGLPGIDFIESNKRYYNMGNFASYTVGFARKLDGDPDTLVGQMGIEQYFNKELKGTDGYTEYQKDAYGYTIPNTTPITVPAKNGEDIYLTIDSKIQLFVENGIRDITNEKNVSMDWLTFSVIDAKTGAVVASSSSPNFNLNTLNITSYINPLIGLSYEPGSTMKIFSFLAAMENGIYDGNALYHSGTVKVDDATIKDFNGVGWGDITYDKGFANSSNVAATYLGLSMGRDKLYNFYDSLGFGKKTGITLPAEEMGNINFQYRTEVATASFGQGIMTTPIQHLQALTVLTNDGVEVQPYIVEKRVDSNTGEVLYQHKRTELGQKASKENAEKMLSLMYNAVYDSITDAAFYKADNVTLVGKSGTAQIPNSYGGYLTGKYDYVRSFAGVFPYEEPRYIVYVAVKRYTGSYRNIANMVKNVVEEISKYKNIVTLTTETDTSKIITMENFISKDLDTSVSELSSRYLNVIAISNGKNIIKQFPPKGSTILSGNKVFLVSDGNEITLPDFTGWSGSEVETYCSLANIKLVKTGYGNAVGQSIPAGTVMSSDMVLEVTLG